MLPVNAAELEALREDVCVFQCCVREGRENLVA